MRPNGPARPVVSARDRDDITTIGRAVHLFRARHKGIDQRGRNVIKDGPREP
jgi:hypothetical protein